MPTSGFRSCAVQHVSCLCQYGDPAKTHERRNDPVDRRASRRHIKRSRRSRRGRSFDLWLTRQKVPKSWGDPASIRISGRYVVEPCHQRFQSLPRRGFLHLCQIRPFIPLVDFKPGQHRQDGNTGACSVFTDFSAEEAFESRVAAKLYFGLCHFGILSPFRVRRTGRRRRITLSDRGMSDRQLETSYLVWQGPALTQIRTPPCRPRMERSAFDALHTCDPAQLISVLLKSRWSAPESRSVPASPAQ